MPPRSVIGAVFAEWVGASAGLGYLILVLNNQTATTEMFAVIVTPASIGILLFLIVTLLERLLLPWYYESRETEGEGLHRSRGEGVSEGTTIVRGAWALTMGPAGAIREGAVAFDGDGAISAVGPADQLMPPIPAPSWSATATASSCPASSMPTPSDRGLITGMGGPRCSGNGSSGWSNPAGLRITREVALGTRLKAVEMLESGITTVNDMVATAIWARGIARCGRRARRDGHARVVSFGAEDIRRRRRAPTSSWPSTSAPPTGSPRRAD